MLSDELDLIGMVTDKIIGGTSVGDVLESIIGGATELLRARRGSIMLVEPGTREMRIHASRGVPDEIIAKARVQVGTGIAGRVAHRGKPLLLTDVNSGTDDKAREKRDYKDASAICVPLRIKGEVLGVMNLNDREDRPFNEADLRLAILIANQAAVGLHNARLMEETREMARIETALHEVKGRETKLRERLGALDLVTLITEKLVASPNLSEVLESLIEESTRLTGAQRGSILIYDDKEEVLRIAASRGIPEDVIDKVRTKPGEGLAGRVFMMGQPLYLSGLSEDHESSSGGSYNSDSSMILPLKMKDQSLGVLNLSNKRGGSDFSDDDFVLARIVANQASIAVYNAQLAASWVENQKMKQALEIAREIQLHFLPQEAPEVEALEIAGWSISCDEIGGDYFDYIPLGEDHVAVAIGDVTGHGIGAALLMATSRAFLRAFASMSPDLADMLFRVNNLLALDTRDDSFMTMFLGAFDFKQRQLRYTSAGHDEPIHYRPSTGQFWDLDSTGIPLGMLEEQEFPTAEVTDIETGDLFVFCTDGVWDARNPDQEAFGRERFLECLGRYKDLSARAIIEAIHADVLEYCGPDKPHDDVSLVVVRIK